MDPSETTAIFGAAAEPHHWKQSFAALPEGVSSRACASGCGSMMRYRVAFRRDRVDVDLCSGCGGLWLDHGEGTRLRELLLFARGAARRRELGIDRPSYLFQLLTGLPVEAWNPVRRRSIAVWCLIVLLVLCFAAELVWLGALERAGTLEQRVRDLMLVPSEVMAGNGLWTIVTSGFLHGGLVHLLGNLYFLKIFGDNVEDQLGARRFLVVFGVALLAGNLLHLAALPGDPRPALGASGAISGLLGAYLVLFPRVRIWVMIVVVRFRVPAFVYLGFWLAYNVLMGYLDGEGVAWWAHVGGFAAGVLLGALFKRGDTRIHPAPSGVDVPPELPW